MTTHQAPLCLLLCPPCPACPSQCRQPPTQRRAAKTAAPRRTKPRSSSGPPLPPSLAGDAWVPPRHTAQPHGPWGHEWPARNWVSSARSLSVQNVSTAPPTPGTISNPQRHISINGGKVWECNAATVYKLWWRFLQGN